MKSIYNHRLNALRPRIIRGNVRRSLKWGLMSLLSFSFSASVNLAIAEEGNGKRPVGAPAGSSVVSSWEVEGQLTSKTKWIVPAPQTGIIEILSIEEGAIVAKEGAIAQLETSLLQQELAVAIASHKAAVIEADQTNDRQLAELTADVRRAELESSRTANRQYAKAVSSSEIQKLQLQLEQAKLTAAQADLRQNMLEEKANEKLATVDLLHKRIDRSSVRSRMNGTVAEVFTQEGDWISEGSPIAAIVDLDVLRFEALVHWSLASKFQANASIQFQPSDAFRSNEQGDAPLESFPGKLKFVSPEINPITKQVRIIVEIENTRGTLRPGMNGSIKP